MKFYRLANGARFTMHGKRFTKCGIGAAQDERGWDCTVLGIMDVWPEGKRLLLSPEKAANWRTNYGPWTEFMEREVGSEAAW